MNILQYIFGKRVFCSDCIHEKNDIKDSMFGIGITYKLCGILEKFEKTSHMMYPSRYMKNIKHNCRDFEQKEWYLITTNHNMYSKKVLNKAIKKWKKKSQEIFYSHSNISMSSRFTENKK
jgi:hypothetical protein